ncbi:hypothetical protein [Candidatus Rhabdochlamydia sp. T3358]|uniref:hypothetical protein n=1 Tax=Candidatus Rhabdochlamydia sp. T3358 TaxID=2099795 RepID=UPI0010B16E5A|nr:hypothetical protein [Candidatus Rhabdochlamydia sp. T3358]VHO02692.1 hypothetical protein RHT_00629 [Candidatus Rhabdochlamydia sp. T3358]
MLKIELNKNEYNYLCQSSFLANRYQEVLSSSKQYNGKYSLKVSEDQADEIRDLCGEQLQLVGFNEKYELTSEGKILEPLIDKFFIE